MDYLSEARRDFSRVGIALFVLLILSDGLVQLAAWIIAGIYGDQIIETTWVALVISMAVQYLIAMPAAFLILRGLKKQPIQPVRMTFGRFCLLFLISYFIMYAGSLLGLGTNTLLEYMTDSTMTSMLDDVFESQNVIVYSVSVVILAPVMEELFFRKLLISRLERFGEAPAIIVSGLVFGIFHGNFSQVYYAVGLGLLLGYVYIRTRKIWITMLLHLLINIIGEIAAPLITGGSLALMGIASAFLMGLVVAGLVLFIIRIRKILILEREGQLPAPGWGQYAYANFGMILFFTGCAAVFVLNSLLTLAPN